VRLQYSAAFLSSIAEFVPPTLPILSVSKGLELSTLEMMSQVIPRALGNPRQPLVVLSGPSFSIELMDELPTGMKLVLELSSLLSSELSFIHHDIWKIF
jgi:glycerol-3-phosphate dehydrogenase (NAD+)